MKADETQPNVTRIYEIMAKLRSPGGCPWDLKQTHESLKPYLLEEAYEVLEAIDADDPLELCEELGDLLLQIVFHSRLAEEQQQFDLSDVIRAISEKMLRRHPHVFADESATTPQEVRDRWEELKREEGRSIFAGLPAHLPALLRAQRVGEKAANIGFDWKSVKPVLAKVKEELNELTDEMETESGRISEELGDLLFALTNLARHLSIDAEGALRASTLRFERRIRAVQRLAEDGDVKLEDCDEGELDELWEQVKAAQVSGGAPPQAPAAPAPPEGEQSSVPKIRSGRKADD